MRVLVAFTAAVILCHAASASSTLQSRRRVLQSGDADADRIERAGDAAAIARAGAEAAVDPDGPSSVEAEAAAQGAGLEAFFPAGGGIAPPIPQVRRCSCLCRHAVQHLCSKLRIRFIVGHMLLVDCRLASHCAGGTHTAPWIN